MDHSPKNPFDVHPAAKDATLIEQADVAVTEAAAQARSHPVVKLLGGMSEVADQPPLISLCSAILALGIVTRQPRIAKAGGRMLAAELLATAIKNAIKKRVDRTRPHVLVDEGRYSVEGHGRNESPVNSFPSGHTAGAVAVARAFSREYPQHRTMAFTAAAGIAAIQIPRGKHYPTDIAAGAVVGLAAEKLVDLAFRTIR